MGYAAKIKRRCKAGPNCRQCFGRSGADAGRISADDQSTLVIVVTDSPDIQRRVGAGSAVDLVGFNAVDVDNVVACRRERQVDLFVGG